MNKQHIWVDVLGITMVDVFKTILSERSHGRLATVLLDYMYVLQLKWTPHPRGPMLGLSIRGQV